MKICEINFPGNIKGKYFTEELGAKKCRLF
jgi:hypothetical protein